jgi:cell division initiation protein
MPVKPIDVRRKEFKNGFRGYDANQVDDFLDEVADDFERVFAEAGRMREEIQVLKGRLEQFEELESSIRAALVHAEKAAEDLRRSAAREAEMTVREAREHAHRILADSSGRVERVQGSYEAMRKAKQDFANDFRHLLKSYLSVMDQADTASAREIEASLRGRLDTESVAVARRAAETREGGGGSRESETGDLLHEGDRGSYGEGSGDAGAPRVYRRERDDAGERMGPLSDGDEEYGEGYGASDGGGVTERIETPTTDEGDSDPDEPEVGPSSTQGLSGADDAYRSEGSGAVREVDREEGMPADDNRTADEFFGEDERRRDPESGSSSGGQGEGEDRRIFRASRFLRRRN